MSVDEYGCSESLQVRKARAISYGYGCKESQPFRSRKIKTHALGDRPNDTAGELKCQGRDYSGEYIDN